MCEMMAFPDTAEEFMEQYKIVDTEQVYTNGAELIPIFRMKQWLEHLQDIEPERNTDGGYDIPAHSIDWKSLERYGRKLLPEPLSIHERRN